MQGKTRLILLEEPALDGVVRMMSDPIALAEGQGESWETITRVIKFEDAYYGTVEITKAMLDTMIKNFQANVYGQDIAVDIAHNPSDGAAGFIRELQVQNGKLRGRVEWTEFGKDAVIKKGYRYFSAEYSEDYRNPETEKKHGPLLMGAALTTRPRVKYLDPIKPELLKLSLDGEGEGAPVLITPKLSQILLHEAEQTMNKFLKKLKESLASLKLSETIVATLLSTFESTAKPLGDDEDALSKLVKQFEDTGASLVKQLSENTGGEIKLSINSPLPGMTADDVKRLLSEARAEEAKLLAESKTQRDAKVKILSDAIAAQDGFSDELKKELTDGVAPLITADMHDDQIKGLANHQIAMGNKMAAQAKLVSLGFSGGPSGSLRISVDESNTIKELQETADRRMGILELSDSKRYARTGGTLLDENKKLADKVLAQYDADHAQQLHAERKMLAGGDGVVSDVAVPSVWERTVIREALYQLIGLQFVDVGTDAFATSYMIPYSYRDTTGAGKGDTRRYEGQSINRAGVIQTAETAYNIPQKLSFEVSDELRLLTQARHLNWEAVSENQRNASRIIGEDLEQLLFNEQLRAADEYLAVAVSGEVLTASVNGTNNVWPLANFPVVRPRSVYDLQGSMVGSATSPITVTLGGSPITEYDGTGTQSAGNYWQMDYNLGEIRIVNQLGALQTPAATTALVVSYSYTSNSYAFDTDLGAALAEDHWNTFLYRYGLRKSVIESDRYHMANFGLMSSTVANQVEQAKQFAANFRRAGTELSANGNVGTIKDVPNFKATAPGLWMGDQRIIIGERGQTRFRMTKPWSLGELENQKDANGRFTGKKEAYGDQFVVVHTPTQLKAALTSMTLYSASARVARAG